MLPDDLVARLRESPFLRSLGQPEVEELARSARVRRVPPRERLWASGDPIPGPVFIISGLVRVYHDDDPARPTTITMFWPGELVAPSILQQEEWITHAVAVAPVVQVTLNRAAFFAACARNSMLAYHLLHDLTVAFYRRYAWEWDLRLVTLTRRLLMMFGRMADELGTPTPKGILLDFPLTHEIVAGLAWVKRDHARRVLNQLAGEGLLVDCPRFRWLIPDRERLGPRHRLPPAHM